MVDFQALQFFCIVAQEGSLSKAAQKLHYAQSNLSTKMVKLEEDFDATLFYRSKQGVTLTPKGETLYQEATRILNILEELKENVNDSSAGSIFKIGATEVSTLTFLPSYLAKFTSKYPQLTLHIDTALSDHLIENVRNYHYDFAFALDVAPHPDLSIKPLSTEELVIISNKNYGENVSYQELFQTPTILFPKGCP